MTTNVTVTRQGRKVWDAWEIPAGTWFTAEEDTGFPGEIYFRTWVDPEYREKADMGFVIAFTAGQEPRYLNRNVKYSQVRFLTNLELVIRD